MKRALYVSLILVLLSAIPAAAQQRTSPVRTVKQLNMITNLAATPAGAWDAFIAFLMDAQERLTINDEDSIKPSRDGKPAVNGVLTEPVGDEPPPPPPSDP